MQADGSQQRQLTHLGAMSWAPYFHPSGEYLIFTTNLQGFANFELYLVDAQGQRDPVRVTHTDGFDGLPVFSPDGKQLAWTSDRASSGNSQIFLASWDHAAARHALGLDGSTPAPQAAPATAKAAETVAPVDLTGTSPEITAADLRRYVEKLAGEEMEGRLTGTPGEQLATAYAAGVMESLGLRPFGDDDGWFEPFEFTAGVALGEKNKLSVTGASDLGPLQVSQDWLPLSLTQTGTVDPTEVVFAGYGIETPDGAEGEPYSSYAHLDVEGKWVMVFRYVPEGVDRERRNQLIRYSSLRHKALTARQKGARGLIVVSGPNSKVVDQLVPLAFDASLASSGVAAISVTDAVAEALLKSTGKTLKDLQDTLDTGELMGGIPCAGVKLGAVLDLKQEKRTGRNVLGVLAAKGEPDFHTPPLMIGAHIDHLGASGGSNSRAKGDELKKIHYGADDNASGVAGLLEIAQWLKSQQDAGKIKLTRDVIFAAWSGEELGLLGSNHFVNELAQMIRGDKEAKLSGMISAYLNMDMIGRFDKTLVLQGVGSSPWWKGEIERRNVPIGLPLTLQNDAHLPTDSTVFYLRGIPTLTAFTGAHEDYHTPGDTADKIHYEDAVRIARLMALISRTLATTQELPEYMAMEAPKNSGERTGLRAYLGTIPDYSQGDIEGVKLSGVSAVGPAAKAGVQAGDVVVGLAGKEIKNIYDYTYIMGDLKIGEETSIVVKRDGKDLTLKVTPQSRD